MSSNDASALRVTVAPGVTSTNDGREHITRPKYGPRGTRLLEFLRINPNLTLHLDDLGTATWPLLDGRTVGDVLAGLQERFPEQPQLGERLGRFLGALHENKFIVLESKPADTV